MPGLETTTRSCCCPYGGPNGPDDVLLVHAQCDARSWNPESVCFRLPLTTAPWRVSPSMPATSV